MDEKVNMTPQEMMDFFKKAYPHVNVRLSRPGDPELSSVFIRFSPKSKKSSSIMQPKKSSPSAPKDLEDIDNLSGSPEDRRQKHLDRRFRKKAEQEKS